MEEGTPILEAFTQNVGDEGPSQPLIRKLMSMTQDPDISGFLQIQPPLPSYGAEGSASTQAAPEDISETVGCPVEDMETVVQSGFRFTGADGTSDSPRTENYFTVSNVPFDLAEKVPIDFLNAINNVLDTKVFPTRRTHHHGKRRSHKRQRAASCFHQSDQPDLASTSGVTSQVTDYGQEMILRRLDRLEEVCGRTESYIHLVLGTLDRRLQLLEAEALSTQRSTRESSCSPRYPAPPGGFSCDTGTLVTPDMLMTLQSPRPDRVFLTPPADASTPYVCLSPIEMLPSPAVILTGSPSTGEFSFSSSEEVAAAPEASTAMGPSVVQPSSDEEDGQKPLVSAAAVFSFAPDGSLPAPESPVDALLSEPVVTWENDGFPYLRPAYQVPEPPLRDTTVLTWSSRYMRPESSSSEEERGTSGSSDDAFSFYNLEDSPTGQGANSSFHQQHEESVLEEVSVILKNICNNLEGLNTPEQSDVSLLETAGCLRCCRNEPVQGKAHEEITSILEEVFTRLEFSPRPEDVLVNMLPTGEARQEVVVVASSVSYQELPQDDNVQAEGSGKIERCFEISSASAPKVSLSFVQEEEELASPAPQDISVKINVPTDSASSVPVTLHVDIAPKELQRKASQEDSEQAATTLVQDICVSLQGPYQEPVICENEYRTGPCSRETVTVSKEKVQIPGDITADYTLKVVPKADMQQEAACSDALRQDESTLINREAVSSVVHELCFSLDVQDDEPPLQIGLALTQAAGDGLPRLVSRSQEEECESSQPHPLASVVLNLEALRKGEEHAGEEHEDGPVSFNWEGIRASGECQDIPCLLKVADRKVVGNGEITSVRQEVCISVEVPAALSEEAGSSSRGSDEVQVGVAVKTVPTRRGDEFSNVISCVEIPEEHPFERAPLTVTTTSQRELETSQEEPVEVKANDFKIVTEVEVVDSIVAPPPSPVEGSPETDEYLFREVEKKPADGEEWVIDSSFLPKEKDNVDSQGGGEVKVPKPVLKGVTPTDLIRGSLRFDGKACLLSVSADDTWTAEDMCQAPDNEKQAAGSKKAGEVPTNISAWLGDVLVESIKQEREGVGVAPAFGFRRGKQGEAKMPAGFGFRQQGKPAAPAAAGVHQGVHVFGFRNLQPRTPASRPVAEEVEQQAQQLMEPVFGFRKSSSRPPLTPKAVKPNISVNVVAADSDLDSSLSVVSRNAAVHSRGNLPQEEQAPMQSVPDSPGARSCIIDGETCSKSSRKTGATTPAIVVSEFDHREVRGGGKVEASTSAVQPLGGVGILEFESSVRGKTSLDLLDAEGASEDEAGDAHAWAAVLPVEGGDEDAFFNALQCPARNESQNKKLKNCLKNKLWSKLSCYGTGLPESDSSDAPGYHERI